jgi:hypothetical protein
MRPCRPAGEETSGQIHSENPIPGFIGFRRKHFAGAASGIVDEYMQTAIGGDGLRDSRFDGHAVRNVAREKRDVPAVRADGLLNRAAFRLPAGEDGYFCSFLRKAASGGFTNSAVAAGNHGYFVLKPACHALVSFE